MSGRSERSLALYRAGVKPLTGMIELRPVITTGAEIMDNVFSR